MKSLLKVALPIALLLGVGFFLTGSRLKRLVPYFKKAKYKSFSLGKIRFTVDMLLENPNRRAMKFNELFANVSINGTTISRIQVYNKSISIAPLSTTLIPNIEIAIETLSLTNQILNIIRNRAASSLQIAGTIKADGLTFPFNSDIPLR